MIVFNENASQQTLEEITKTQIAPLFKKLENMTKDGKIEWEKHDKSAPYETCIMKEDNEQWRIKLFDDMLMIEWSHYNGKKTSRYTEHSKCFRTKFNKYDRDYSYLKERITVSPELLADCIKFIGE